MIFNRVLTTATVLLSAALSAAQPATVAQRAGVPANPGYATMHLETSVGSTRSVDSEGRYEISFRGTVLISQLTGFTAGSKGSVQVFGDVKKQYDANNRQVYFGRGRIVITGKWRSIHWFGGDMKTVWFGKGRVQVTGEYDKNLKTGALWYDDPKKRIDFPVNGLLEYILPVRTTPPPTPPAPRT